MVPVPPPELSSTMLNHDIFSASLIADHPTTSSTTTTTPTSSIAPIRKKKIQQCFKCGHDRNGKLFR
jgi:hypothetical protein